MPLDYLVLYDNFHNSEVAYKFISIEVYRDLSNASYLAVNTLALADNQHI